MKVVLGKMILKHCAERGWTLAVLARRSGVPKPTLHGWTTGRNSTNPLQLKLVSQALGVSLHELIFGEPDPIGSGGSIPLEELFSGKVSITISRGKE